MSKNQDESNAVDKENQRQNTDIERLKLYLNFGKFVATLFFGTVLGTFLTWYINYKEVQIKESESKLQLQLSEREELAKYFRYTMEGDVYDRLNLSIFFGEVLTDEYTRILWKNYSSRQEELLDEYLKVSKKLGRIDEYQFQQAKLEKLIDPIKVEIKPTSNSNPDWNKVHVPLIRETCRQLNVSDPKQVAYILATAEYESGFGKWMEELASGAAYEGRQDLGNTQPGDGARYKGRGYAQITGRQQYNKFSKIVGTDIVNDPNLVSKPEIAAKLLVIGMRDGLFTGHKLSDFIGNDFLKARRIVNNSLNHASSIAERAEVYYSDLQNMKNR